MEYTAPVTERDYVRAYWLNCKSGFRTFTTVLIYFATAAFWLIVVASWSYAAMHRNTNGGQFAGASANVLLPVALLLLLWVVVFRVVVPVVVRGRYRKSGLAGADVHFKVEQEGLRIQPSQLAEEMTPWSKFRYWRESNDLFVVGASLDKYCLLPKGSLSSEQQDALRAVLIPVLRKK